jgi:serine kinase of HPr protein (carbohydrate metabolism regulator)
VAAVTPAVPAVRTVHATCVAIGRIGVLIRGRSGSGKSDLALRLLDGGARLVADDRVGLERDGDRLVARPPRELAGLLEVRGLGIVRLAHRASATVGLVVDLDIAPDRLPRRRSCVVAGVRLPWLALDARHASAPAKLRLALRRPSLEG